MNTLTISAESSVVTPPNSTECLIPVDDVQDIDKKIRALKKKVNQNDSTTAIDFIYLGQSRDCLMHGLC